MSLAERDVVLLELMDDPECDPALLRATLRRFETINRLVSRWRSVYRSRIRPFLATLDRPARVLDLGCGGGDVIAQLAAWAESDGFEVEWVGVDPDPRALEVALTRPAPARTTFLCADGADLLAAGERFDLVLSNHVVHHLTQSELAEFVDQSRRALAGHRPARRHRARAPRVCPVRDRDHALLARDVPAHRRAALHPPQLPAERARRSSRRPVARREARAVPPAGGGTRNRW